MLQKSKYFDKKKVIMFILIFILTVSIMEYSPAIVRFLINQFK